VDIEAPIANGKFANFQFSICNIYGQQVFSKSFSSSPKAHWDGRDNAGNRLPAGSYTIVISTGKARQSARVFLIR
jgi:flagellar hook assembly protein FlgD